MARDTYLAAYDGGGYQFQQDDAHRLAASLRSEATIKDGVIRWNSNGQVPPEDCVALAVHIGLAVDEAACTAARDADTSAFLAAYRRHPPRVTAEQRVEMRAAFGKGAELVNVVTGRRLRV